MKARTTSDRPAARRRPARSRPPGRRRGSRIARIIGKYRVVGPLGRGGMGTVYRAVDTTLEREVAIKVLHRHRADPRIVARFHTEATTLAKLNHPEISTIFELCRSRHDLALVLELVRGETIESVCERLGPLAPQDAASIADKILSALDHAHGAGIVHCDVKPANVMLTEGGRIKIMDFGTARVRRDTSGAPDECAVGTPSYMSPEQLLGETVDGRADLYAVGVVLYRLLTGRLPFEGRNALAVAQQHIGQEPPALRNLRDNLPDWCDTVLRRALAKSPADRFQTAGEFREALSKATGLTAADLAQPCAIPVQVADGGGPPSMRVPRSRRGGRRGGSTMVLNAVGRTASMFRAVVKPRRRHAGPGSGRVVALNSIAALIVVGVTALMLASWRVVAVAPASSVPSRPAIVLRAKAVGNRTRARDTACRVELTADRITVNAADTNAVLHDVPYGQVLSVGSSARRARGGPPAHDAVAVRTSKPKSELIVLRFDGEAEAKRAVAAIEERLPTPSRETREPAR